MKTDYLIKFKKKIKQNLQQVWRAVLKSLQAHPKTYLLVLSSLVLIVALIPILNSIKKSQTLGIIMGIQNNEYFIPLTSAKPKHKKWRNVSSSHFLVYETIRKNIDHIIVNDDIYKKGSKEEEIIHVLSVLDIKKMIPLVQNCYEKIDIENINDKKFQSLLKKELDFCKKHKKKILKKVENFYTTQVKNNTVKFASCNFALLEKAMEDYKKEKE